jgi:hypothetical protein
MTGHDKAAQAAPNVAERTTAEPAAGEWQIIHVGRQRRPPDIVERIADWIWPYLVVDPEGWPVANRSTLRGARRVLRRFKAQRAVGDLGADVDPWWERPIVYREKP